MVTQTAGTYNSKDVAAATTVTASLTASNFTAGAGTLASNYNLSITASGAGHITAVTLTASIIGDPTRPYNGNTMATLTSADFSLVGLIGSESFTVTKTTGTYNSKDVATANNVTTSLGAGDFAPAGGVLASNYTLPTTASGAGHITLATPTVTVTDPMPTYDGSPHSATATATGVGGAGVSGMFSFTYDGSGAPTSAKTSYAVVATFTSMDPNYTGATGNGKLTIKQATPAVVASGGPFTYDGSTHAATTTATGVGGVSVSGAFIVTYTPGGGPPVNAGPYSVSVNFTSGDPNYTNSSGTGSITIAKALAPVGLSNLNQSYTGSPLAATATTVPAGLPLTITYNPVTPTNPGSYTVNTTVVDQNYYGAATGTLIIADVAPTVKITAPASGMIVAAGTTVTFTGTFSDIGPKGLYTAKFTFDGGTTVNGNLTLNSDQKSGAVTASYTFTSAGVYNITLAVTDAFSTTGTAGTVNNDNTSPAYIVVYDPTAGFVTGGGWIMSNPGSYVANSALTGKANFGFVSKYQKGATVPTGETEFNFQVANFNFHASVYQWMVVSGSQAQYKGTGMINGSGTYSFLLTARDGDLAGGGILDGFRIKIMDSTGTTVIYDNKIGTTDDLANTQNLGGGSIVIHTK